MTSAKHTFAILALLLVATQLLFFTTGCGYSTPHTRTATFDKDGDGKIRIFLAMWSNNTNLLGFQGHVEQSLIQVLTKSNRLYLTQNKASADYILDGTLYSVEIPGLSYGAFDRAVEVRAEVKLGYRLREATTGKVIFQKDKYIKRETFQVGGDAVQTQSNQDIALLTLAKDLADDIDIQLFYLFTRDGISQSSQDLVPPDDIEALD
ncbi:MAG: LPS assembly lipoprotein LptE [Thermodesulfobacteriota bacterium]